MFDCQPTLAAAGWQDGCAASSVKSTLWIESHPLPDSLPHAELAREIAPEKSPPREHLPPPHPSSRTSSAMSLHFVQADGTRLDGVSEFLTVSLWPKSSACPRAPRGDLGLCITSRLFNHIAVDRSRLPSSNPTSQDPRLSSKR